MKPKTAEWHYNSTKPHGWIVYGDRTADSKSHIDAIVESVRYEIADALGEAMGSGDRDLPQLIEHVRRLAQAAKQKPAEVAIETAEERNGRREWELFWNGAASVPWDDESLEERTRWIDYAATVQRPKVSPGQRLFAVIRRIYGMATTWDESRFKDELEAAALELGIKECDA